MLSILMKQYYGIKKLSLNNILDYKSLKYYSAV